jgi:uncharacterized protein YbaR (Trm112 family)
VVSQELLDILRCPSCVRDGPEAGLLDHEGNWLICSSCDRKYPIRDDIPVMLIEEGDRFKDVAREELPEVPPSEERKPVAATPQAPEAMDERQKLFLLLVGLAAGALLILLLVKLLKRDRSE